MSKGAASNPSSSSVAEGPENSGKQLRCDPQVDGFWVAVFQQQYIPRIIHRKLLPTSQLKLVCKTFKVTVDSLVKKQFQIAQQNLNALRQKSSETVYDATIFNEEHMDLSNRENGVNAVITSAGEHYKIKIDRQMLLEVANFGPVPSIVKGLTEPYFEKQLVKIRRVLLKGLFRYEALSGSCLSYLASVLPLMSGLTGFSAIGSFGDEGVSAIAAAISQTTHNFRELAIESDQQVERGGCVLCRIIAEKQGLEHVRIVNLFRGVGVWAFSGAIYFAPDLLSITLNGCKINDEQAGWIAEGMKNKNSKLQSIDLTKNLIRAAGAQKILEIGRRAPALKSINLSHNKLHLLEVGEMEGLEVRGHVGVMEKQKWEADKWTTSTARLFVYCQVF